MRHGIQTRRERRTANDASVHSFIGPESNRSRRKRQNSHRYAGQCLRNEFTDGSEPIFLLRYPQGTTPLGFGLPQRAGAQAAAVPRARDETTSTLVPPGV